MAQVVEAKIVQTRITSSAMKRSLDVCFDTENKTPVGSASSRSALFEF
jgi:hypothetical protein